MSLKHTAQQGSGRGELFDQGVLSVVRSVEGTGRYTLNRMAAVLALLPHHERGLAILTAEEQADARTFLAAKGWTPEEGAQYAVGVSHAQNLLFHFARG